MPLEWLNAFHRRQKKSPDYAEKTLAAYALGMKGKGAIVGVRIQVGDPCCDAARLLPADQIFVPANAPRLPLPGCPHAERCGCVYRPAMRYEVPER